MKRIKVKTIKHINNDKNIDKNIDENIDDNIDKYIINFKFGDKKVDLDDYQKKLLDVPIDKNIRIIACAGSGKTTTILCKIKHMLDKYNINEKRIMCTTFNTDAAFIIKKRLHQLLNKDSSIRIGTFDSISAHFYFKYFKQDGFVGVNEYATLLLKYLNTPDGKIILNLYDYIFFDEFQDINNIQFEIIKKFAENGTKIIAIGDDAQNIYQWRGSNISYILNFDKIFNNTITIKLENNYRSTPEIINMSTAIIKNNTDQIEKNMLATQKSINKKPIIVKYNNQTLQALDIIEQIVNLIKNNEKPDDIVIIARNNFGLKLFEEQLELYNRDNTEKKRIEYIALINDNDKNASKTYENKLCLATIHKIKGCEWNNVFLIDLDDKIFPSDCDDIGIQEERRLLYVAVTRAKKFLQISFTSNTISRFITEINKNLYDFPNFKNMYFNINNNNRNFQTKTKVTELIQLLNNEDYEYMRQQNIIPKIQLSEIEIHTKNKINQDILEHNLSADYGIYIDTYISRTFGLKNEKSHGLDNTVAKCTIYSLELNNMMYAIYLESKLSLYMFIYGKMIVTHFNDIYKNYDRNKVENIEDIMHRIINKSVKLNVEPYEIYVTKNGFLPDEFTSTMIISYNNYILPKQIDNKDIYNISLCHNVFMNRKRLLYRIDCYSMFDINKKIYNDIDIYCDNYNTHDIHIKKVINDTERLISGELDMYDKSDKKIIDFKTSINDKIQIEWILQLLTYTALMRLHTKNIVNIISIYNPISGIEYNIDIKTWNKEKELLDLLKKVR
jgi:superfamily I DNA and RNA helicase